MNAWIGTLLLLPSDSDKLLSRQRTVLAETDKSGRAVAFHHNLLQDTNAGTLLRTDWTCLIFHGAGQGVKTAVSGKWRGAPGSRLGHSRGLVSLEEGQVGGLCLREEKGLLLLGRGGEKTGGASAPPTHTYR